MDPTPGHESIRTARLDLIALSEPFVAFLVAGDARAAAGEIGARVGPWLASQRDHVVQLHLAEAAGRAAGFAGLGWLIVLADRSRRHVIGSIGFHGPPDDRGRLEVGCRIHPMYRGRGYAAEALAAVLASATTRFGITRFLVVVPSPGTALDLVPIEISSRSGSSSGEPIEGLADLVELERRAVERP
ncbi:MAG: GNAT family N-acetyltransferase [Chloroflexota bacterium]